MHLESFQLISVLARRKKKKKKEVGFSNSAHACAENLKQSVLL
jgi:hypothetical protein